MTEIQDAMKQWDAGKIDDASLHYAIEALRSAIATIEACGANWIITMGLITQLHSMEMARDSRQRERKS